MSTQVEPQKKIDWYGDIKESKKQINKLGNNNQGIFLERTLGDYPQAKRERLFMEQWQHENDVTEKLATNFGFGILQDLLIAKGRVGTFERRAVIRITPTHRFVVATVIQWLGSNVGFSFLQNCLEKCGYDLVKRKDHE